MKARSGMPRRSEAVAEKRCVALALERGRREIAGEQKEETHEVGLVVWRRRA